MAHQLTPSVAHLTLTDECGRCHCELTLFCLSDSDAMCRRTFTVDEVEAMQAIAFQDLLNFGYMWNIYVRIYQYFMIWQCIRKTLKVSKKMWCPSKYENQVLTHKQETLLITVDSINRFSRISSRDSVERTEASAHTVLLWEHGHQCVPAVRPHCRTQLFVLGLKSSRSLGTRHSHLIPLHSHVHILFPQCFEWVSVVSLFLASVM